MPPWSRFSAIEVMRWVGSRRLPFTIRELAEGVDTSTEVARRWLADLATLDLVERAGARPGGPHPPRQLWRSRYSLEVLSEGGMELRRELQERPSVLGMEVVVNPSLPEGAWDLRASPTRGARPPTKP